MADAQTRTFEIGLAMVGAISAGAYSGGVFDFLLQALDEWEKAKANNIPDIPNHQVVIKVLSGASAGAITGAIAFAGGLKPQKFDAPAPRQQKYRCTLSSRDSWGTCRRCRPAQPGGPEAPR
jgi:predicted acylesterase/phospholipase RssA